MRILTLIGVASLLSFPAFADANGTWDKDDETALAETSQMMQDPTLRNQAIRGDAEAIKATDQLKALAGGDPAKEAVMMKMAADVFAKVAKEEGGNEGKIKERLGAIMANPNSMSGVMTDSQKTELRGLAATTKAPQ